MISQKHTINNVEYIVRARTKTELDKAVKFLYDCNEYEMAQLEEELNVALDKLLVERLGEPQDVTEERFFAGTKDAKPAIETPVEMPKMSTSTEKQTPPLKKSPAKSKTAGQTSAKRVDNKTVDLGRIGKGK